jgi:hypothetical protein
MHSFANRFGIERVALAALDIGLHVRRRYQAHLLPHRGKRACSMVRSPARFHADQA